jgi:hypothetical protein
MKVFVSYAFNDANKWVEDLVFPLVTSLGYERVTGQRLEGEVLIDGVDARLRGCTGCIAFTTKRGQRADGTYETHPWVVNEMHTARALKFKTIEIREEGVKIGDAADAYVRLKYQEAERDRMLIALAQKLADWRTKRVRVELVPPQEIEVQFRAHVLGARREGRAGVNCTYRVESLDGEVLANSSTLVRPLTNSFIVDVELPSDEVLVWFEVPKPNGNGAWMSSGDGLTGVRVVLNDI